MLPFRASLDIAKISFGPTKGLLWIQGQRDDGGFLPAKGYAIFPLLLGVTTLSWPHLEQILGWGAEMPSILALDASCARITSSNPGIKLGTETGNW